MSLARVIEDDSARGHGDDAVAQAPASGCIAQLIATYGGGGAERVTFSIARGLHRIGRPSLCIALREPGPYAEQDDSGTEVISLGMHHGGKAGVVRAARRLRHWIRERNIAVLHVHGSGLSLPFATLATRLMRRPPRLWFTWHTPQSVLDETGTRLRLVRWALGRCERIYGDSQAIIDRIIERAPELAGRAAVFRNAVAETDWTADVAADPPTIVWLARFTEIKDPQILIRAAARLRAEGLRFRVVLAGAAMSHDRTDYGPRTLRLIDELALGDVIDAPGWVDDVPALLRRSAIGVQTSYHEGLSLTLLEMMMAGLAIVATDCGDTITAVKHEHNGLVIRPGDEDALTAALHRLIEDQSLRQRLAATARESALARFSERAMAERVAASIPTY